MVKMGILMAGGGKSFQQPTEANGGNEIVSVRRIRYEPPQIRQSLRPNFELPNFQLEAVGSHKVYYISLWTLTLTPFTHSGPEEHDHPYCLERGW